MSAAALTDRQRRHLKRARYLARKLDSQWEVAGIRFGWDSLLGLFPVAGDGLSALISLYIVYAAWRMGTPLPDLLRMILNLAVEAVLGSVPLLGDVLDIGWKANLRNVALLESRSALEPEQADADKAGWLVLLLVGLLVLTGVWAVIQLWRWLELSGFAPGATL